MSTFPQKITFLLFLLLPFAACFSQQDNIKFERITIANGLSQNNVTSIAQDQTGYLWFGTLDGLNKFDGYTFKVYKHSLDDLNSLSANTISSLHADRNDNLWIGTMAAGLNQLDLRTEVFSSYSTTSKESKRLSSNRIRALWEDRNGNLWVGTRDGGLNYIDLEHETVYHFRHDPEDPNSLGDDHVRSICQDRNGNLWIGTQEGGVNLLTDEERERIVTGSVRFVRFRHNPDDVNSLSNNHVECIFEDRAGTLWIGTYGGGLNKVLDLDSLNASVGPGALKVRRYVHDPRNGHSLSNDFVETIAEDHKGSLWVGTAQGGLNRYEAATQTFVSYTFDHNNPMSLSHDNVEVIKTDRSGNLWIGTWGGGVNKVDRKDRKFVHYYHDPNDANSLSYDYVRSIAEDPYGYLWVGTSGGGIDRFDRRSGKVWNYRNEINKPYSLSSPDVRAIRLDRNQTLWVGTYGGGLNRLLSRVPKQTERPELEFKHYTHESGNPGSLSNDFVWCIYEDRAGTIWIGTNAGLDRLDPATETFEHFTHIREALSTLSHDIVRTIYGDKAGRLWVGTYGGLNLFDPPTKTFVRYVHDPENPRSLSSNAVVSLLEDSNGSLWIGTLGGGLNRFDSTSKSFIHYTEKDGLPNAFVHAILEDEEGFLWLSTNKGLSRFDPANQVFRNYDVDDGLQSNEFNAGAFYKSARGEIFFGGINGFNSFFSKQVKNNPFIPAIAITAFKVFNEPMAFGQALSYIDEIQLSYKQNFFSFEFAALDFTNPKKNQHAHKMEGFDQDWILSGERRFVNYTNLDPGEYVFRVKGTNNDGVWNEKGASVRVVITPPFWGTWWFRGLLGVLTVGVLWIAYRNRISSLVQAKAAQERFSRQLIEFQEKERRRISSELHDSLGQNLLIIKNSVEQYIDSQAKGKGSVQDLEELSSLAAQTINEVREISYNLHPHIIERLGLTKAVGAIVRKVSQSTKIKFKAEVDDIDNLLSKADELHVYRILQEGINNLVKHANASEAVIQMNKENGVLNLLVIDNGRGFDYRAQLPGGSKTHGFGLSGIAERVKILRGELQIHSSKKGTRLKIKIPTSWQV